MAKVWAGIFLFILAGTTTVPVTPVCAEQLVISADMQWAYAQKIVQEGDFQTALVEYKRFLHFFPDDPRIPRAKFQTGICLYELKRYHEAAKLFNTLILDETAGEVRDQSVFLQSRSFHRMGNTGYAKIVLLNYLKLTRDETVQDQLHSALADLHVAFFKGQNKGELEQAKERLARISKQGRDVHQVRERMDAIEKALASPEKNPTLAGALSILPGAGFFYCERYRDALVAFLLNAGLIFAAYESFDQGNEALGGVIAFVETGFFMGNIYGSINAAHRHNRDGKLKILGRRFDIFSKADIENKAWMVGLKYDF